MRFEVRTVGDEWWTVEPLGAIVVPAEHPGQRAVAETHITNVLDDTGRLGRDTLGVHRCHEHEVELLDVANLVNLPHQADADEGKASGGGAADELRGGDVLHLALPADALRSRQESLSAFRACQEAHVQGVPHPVTRQQAEHPEVRERLEVRPLVVEPHRLLQELEAGVVSAALQRQGGGAANADVSLVLQNVEQRQAGAQGGVAAPPERVAAALADVRIGIRACPFAERLDGRSHRLPKLPQRVGGGVADLGNRVREGGHQLRLSIGGRVLRQVPGGLGSDSGRGVAKAGDRFVGCVHSRFRG